MDENPYEPPNAASVVQRESPNLIRVLWTITNIVVIWGLPAMVVLKVVAALVYTAIFPGFGW